MWLARLPIPTFDICIRLKLHSTPWKMEQYLVHDAGRFRRQRWPQLAFDASFPPSRLLP